MKKVFFLLFAVFLLPSLLGLDLEIEKKSSNEVMIHEFQNPVTFDLEITNKGENESISFYNLVGFSMSPREKINIGENETKSVQLEVEPLGGVDRTGYYTFNYFIRGKDKTDLKKQLTFKIVPLKDAFELGSENLNINEESVDIYLENKINHDFEEIHGTFESSFFDFEETFSLDANEKHSFSVDLNKEQVNRLLAGFYTIKGNLVMQEEIVDLEGVIEFSENDSLYETEESYGFLVNTQKIKKSNEGNTLLDASISVKKNIFSRLFTSFNIEPDAVERKGSEVVYLWKRELSPGEDLEVVVKTNWILPFIFVLLLVAVVIAVKKYSRKDIDLKKRISFVKAKGGEFALKVSLIIKANEYVEKVNVVEKLPPLVKLYDKYGTEKPTKIDEKGKKLEWYFSQLDAGEKRVVSYVVYSKVGILGKFALPSATAIFEKEGKVRESSSNKAFFVSEQKVPKEEI